MYKTRALFEEYRGIIGFIAIGLLIACFILVKRSEMRKHGIITVAKVIEYEAAESGSSLRIQVYLKDKVITAYVANECYFCAGKYYFVKVLKDDPTNYPIIYMEKPVPDCIIENVKYYKGWDDFPTCNNY